MTEFSVQRSSWTEAGAALGAIRHQVFIEEQGVPRELEWDGLDEDAEHLLAVDTDGQAIGCARVLAGGHIGRMAVLAPWRGRGVGRALLQRSIALCRRRGDPLLILNAQVQVTGFYARAGFITIGDEFMDAGIPHRRMELDLNQVDTSTLSGCEPQGIGS